MTDTMDAATLVTTRLVQVGKEEAFARWVARYEAETCAQPGCRGIVRLEQPDGMVHLVQRFASAGDRDRWRDSAGHRALEQAADAVSNGREQSEDGTTVSLRLPSEAAAPKWKSFVATWACVYPLLLALNLLVAVLPLQLPKPVQLALTSLAMTATLTWFILPFVRRRLRPWLLADPEGLRKEPG